MANSLEFKITAEDQASRTVETVQNKIQNFGRDIAKMALGFAGPLALVQIGMTKIGELLDEQSKKRQEAIDFGASGLYEELKARTKIADELERGYKAILAQKKLTDESAAQAEKEKLAREEATKLFLATERGKAQINITIPSGPGSAFMGTNVFKRDISEAARDVKIQAEALKTTVEIVKELDKENERLKEQKAAWQNLSESVNAYRENLIQTERSRKQELEYVNRIKKAQSDLVDLQVQSKQMQGAVSGASSMAEAGGGYGGEQRSLAAAQDRMIQEQERVAGIQTKLAEENIAIAVALKAGVDSLNITLTNFSKVVTEMPSVTSGMDLNVGGPTYNINDTY